MSVYIQWLQFLHCHGCVGELEALVIISPQTEVFFSVTSVHPPSVLFVPVTADPLAVHEASGATCSTQQPFASVPLWGPTDQVSASTAISSFTSPQLSSGTNGGLRLCVGPPLTISVLEVGLSSFQQLVIASLPKLSISFQVAS